MNQKKILAIIPARGGSKGIPDKNIINLGGKPLIAWSIKASLESKYITKTIVSSDSDKILEIAKQYGADLINRPFELATDFASSESVVKHAIESILEQFEYIILLQPTSPLRDNLDIDNAIEKLFESKGTALISVNECNNKILKAFKETDGKYIEGIVNNKFPFMRRQDLPKTYMSNGAIYIIKIDEFLERNSFFTNKTIPFLIDEAKSLDIDTIEDLKKVEEYINKIN